MGKDETWLKRELRTRDVSGHWLARQIGYSNSQTHRYITGEQPPTYKACQRIAVALGMEEQEVMRQVGRLSPLPEDYNAQQEQRLVEMFQTLKSIEREQLLRFAEFLVDGQD